MFDGGLSISRSIERENSILLVKQNTQKNETHTQCTPIFRPMLYYITACKTFWCLLDRRDWWIGRSHDMCFEQPCHEAVWQSDRQISLCHIFSDIFKSWFWKLFSPGVLRLSQFNPPLGCRHSEARQKFKVPLLRRISLYILSRKLWDIKKQ
jgi:hypothetical protein